MVSRGVITRRVIKRDNPMIILSSRPLSQRTASVKPQRPHDWSRDPRPARPCAPRRTRARRRRGAARGRTAHAALRRPRLRARRSPPLAPAGLPRGHPRLRQNSRRDRRVLPSASSREDRPCWSRGRSRRRSRRCGGRPGRRVPRTARAITLQQNDIRAWKRRRARRRRRHIGPAGRRRSRRHGRGDGQHASIACTTSGSRDCTVCFANTTGSGWPASSWWPPEWKARYPAWWRGWCRYRSSRCLPASATAPASAGWPRCSAMLNSCANGVSVVNIDNGFGAGCIASLINHLPPADDLWDGERAVDG